MNLTDLLSTQTGERGEVPAIIDRHRRGSRTTTFRALEAHVVRMAAVLTAGGGGLRPGEAVLIFQPMSMELYAVLLAIFRVGGVAMFVDPSAGAAHLEACCALLPPRAFIASPKGQLLRLRSPALRRIPLKFSLGWTPFPATNLARAAGEMVPPVHPAKGDDPALLTFTSGSTGQPKAAVRSHGFLLAQHRVLDRHLRLAPAQRDLTTLPIFGLANLASGVTTIVPDVDLRRPGDIDARRLHSWMLDHKPTRIAASPALLERLADYLEQTNQAADFRHIHTGGAPVFPRLLRKLARVAPQAEIVAVYGSTEAEPIAEVPLRAISQADLDAMRSGRGLLTGRPIDEIELRIIQDQWGRPIEPLTPQFFDAMCSKTGESGEIVVSGDHVLKGYLDGRGDAETKFRVHHQVWHRTGDAGYLDTEGRLWLLGRCSARLEGSVYPFSVEAATMEWDWVRRSAVLQLGGRRILAVEPEANYETATKELKKALAWAAIDEVRIVGRIPVDRRHNAKVDYPALESLLKS